MKAQYNLFHCSGNFKSSVNADQSTKKHNMPLKNKEKNEYYQIIARHYKHDPSNIFKHFDPDHDIESENKNCQLFELRTFI